MNTVVLPRSEQQPSEQAAAILEGNARMHFGSFGAAVECGRFPTLPLLNQFLAEGHDPEDGDGGGQWQPFTLSAEDYVRVRDTWLATHPGAVVDDFGAATWRQWTMALHARIAGVDDWTPANDPAGADHPGFGPAGVALAPETVAAIALAGAACCAPEPEEGLPAVNDRGPLHARCPCCGARSVAGWRKLLPLAGGACPDCHRPWRHSRAALPLAVGSVVALLVFVSAAHPGLGLLRGVIAGTALALVAALCLLPLRRRF